jgi:hypothetical protein
MYKAENSQLPALGKPSPESARVVHAPTPGSLLVANNPPQSKTSPPKTRNEVHDLHALDRGGSSPTRAGHAPNRGENARPRLETTGPKEACDHHREARVAEIRARTHRSSAK